MLHPVTPAGEIALEMTLVLALGAALIFAAVMLLLVRALTRRQPRRPINRWAWLFGGGIVFPITVLSALLAYSTARTLQLIEPSADRMVITVTGVQWWWEVTYRDPTGRKIVAANELRIPVGRPITLGLSTRDVIHSFWVPALGGKVDMVPGRVHQMHVQVTAAGIYRGVCAEFCGDQHAKMALPVVALAPEEFDRWLAAQGDPARSNSSTQRGQQLFAQLRCNACHNVRGLFEASQVGPDLTHVAARPYIGAGALPTSEGNFRDWVAHLQRVKPGARMPSYGHLDDESLAALAAFLASLQ